jgi:hypothetical protein
MVTVVLFGEEGGFATSSKLAFYFSELLLISIDEELLESLLRPTDKPEEQLLKPLFHTVS